MSPVRRPKKEARARPAARRGRRGPARPAAKPWESLVARDLMRTDVVTIPYSAPLSEIERVFADHRVSGAPVVDEAGRIVGVVSVRDLIERYAEDPDSHPRRGHGFYELADEADPEDVAESFEVPEEAEETAEDVMTAQVLSVPVDATLRRIAREMRRHRVHRLLVVEAGKHVGIVSSTEVLDALAR